MTNIKQPTQNKRNKIILFLMAIIFVISFFSFLPGQIAHAEELTTSASPVLEDLQKDENFKIEDYPSVTPANKEDYTIKVIQIAESTAQELFIYTYQPCAETKELLATSINISTTIKDNLQYDNYTLKFLNSDGLFQKYVVNNLSVKKDTVRYYDISSIFRANDKDLDKDLENGNSVSERSYAVGQLWTACTLNNEVSYSCEIRETIEIENKFVGFVRYITSDGGIWQDWITGADTSCDRHFVAFSTDRQIDELIEADVKFQTQTIRIYSYNDMNIFKPRHEEITYGDVEDSKANLVITDEKEVKANIVTGFTSHSFSYSWKSIQTVNDFIGSVNVSNMYSSGVLNNRVESKITDEKLNELKKMQWVLTFDNTEYSCYKGGAPTSEIDERYTINSNVTILRLKFKYDGDVYNLGVVDNKQTGSNEPINDSKIETTINWQKVFDIAVKILLIVLAIVCLPLIIQLIPLFFNFIFWVISLPFKLIKLIFGKRRK